MTTTSISLLSKPSHPSHKAVVRTRPYARHPQTINLSAVSRTTHCRARPAGYCARCFMQRGLKNVSNRMDVVWFYADLQCDGDTIKDISDTFQFQIYTKQHQWTTFQQKSFQNHFLDFPYKNTPKSLRYLKSIRFEEFSLLSPDLMTMRPFKNYIVIYNIHF